jgi:hypothetical protein
MFAGLRFAGVLALGLGIFGATLLPSDAGEYRGAGPDFIHRGMHGTGFGNRSSDHGRFDVRSGIHDGYRFDSFGRGKNVRNDRPHFGHDDHFWQASNGDRFHANHPRRLQRLASGDFSTARGSGITIQRGDRANYNSIGNDAGASDSYSTAAGTYSVGYGDYQEQSPSVTALMPRAKIIDVATMHDVCSYESGVCVIRP